ncbi:putative F-box/FBD/LRR-repeat protein at1g78760 [Phtheirospermum japonicum]|uniref:Putative F-box/FBD/LRR-repeat protein at1g78760 n=1 Tax=Phtheirospermum japonicum TaxID=374723 RepID=A0A830D7Q7_9LAMI|nr:putative F-box/FBD/LRR-repeat protein at1g78760 [Phtheirospermum japonicum]
MFFDEVCRFLSLRSGFKIYDLSLHCCYTKSNASRFEQFIVSLGRLGIESLGLRPWIRAFYSDPFSFSCHLISQMPTLKLLSLVRCSLASLKLTQSNNSLLQVLSLTRVTVADGALECILSNCLSLHSLEFSDCALPSKLFIRGSNLQLKTFCIIGCWDMEEIEFYASNLVTFEFKSPEVANFLFDHVPKLQNIFLDLKYENTMSYVCAKLVKDMPHLKYLIFSTEGDIYQVCSRTMRINTFSNLRQLSLRLYAISSPDRVDLLLMTSFLEKCPLLQEFHLDCDFLKCDDGQKAKRPVAVIHSELKKVEISGHSGTKNEMEFALYILKSAICLEQMHIKLVDILM